MLRSLRLWLRWPGEVLPFPAQHPVVLVLMPAAVKAMAVTVLAGATKALNGPPATPHEATAQDWSLVAEVGCVLTIGNRAAAALLAEAHALTTCLPRSLAALQAGTMSWAHARGMVDQTTGIEPARRR